MFGLSRSFLNVVKFSHNNLKTKVDLTEDSRQFYTWNDINSAAIGGCSFILLILKEWDVIQCQTTCMNAI